MDNRNFEIATKVFGLEMQVVKPDWYKHEVYCFYDKDCKLMRYSWDQDGCNAQMFVNGLDSSLGFATPLPNFFEDMEGGEWEIVSAMEERGFYFWMASEPTFSGVEYRAQFFLYGQFQQGGGVVAQTPPEAIAEAALQALSVTKNATSSL